MPVDVVQERWPIEVKKEASPHDADRTFPFRHHAYFIKGLNRNKNSNNFFFFDTKFERHKKQEHEQEQEQERK